MKILHTGQSKYLNVCGKYHQNKKNETNLSPAMFYVSCIACHISPVTRKSGKKTRTTKKTKTTKDNKKIQKHLHKQETLNPSTCEKSKIDKNIFKKKSSVRCHVSGITCHMSCVTCCVSPVTRQVSQAPSATATDDAAADFDLYPSTMSCRDHFLAKITNSGKFSIHYFSI